MADRSLSDELQWEVQRLAVACFLETETRELLKRRELERRVIECRIADLVERVKTMEAACAPAS